MRAAAQAPVSPTSGSLLARACRTSAASSRICSRAMVSRAQARHQAPWSCSPLARVRSRSTRVRLCGRDAADRRSRRAAWGRSSSSGTTHSDTSCRTTASISSTACARFPAVRLLRFTRARWISSGGWPSASSDRIRSRPASARRERPESRGHPSTYRRFDGRPGGRLGRARSLGGVRAPVGHFRAAPRPPPRPPESRGWLERRGSWQTRSSAGAEPFEWRWPAHSPQFAGTPQPSPCSATRRSSLGGGGLASSVGASPR